MALKQYSLLIKGTRTNGGEINGGEVIVKAPYDGSAIARMEAADSAAAELALANAYEVANDRKKWLSPMRRLGILSRLVELMKSRTEELAREAACEGGKPLMDSQVEIKRGIEGVEECIKVLKTESGYTVPMNLNAASQHKLAFTSKEPIGVVLAISAFNHPFNLIVHQVMPAVAAGCPFIVKPADATPLSCYAIVRMLREAGLPEEWGQALVVKDLQVASAMVADSRIAFFSFIGSSKVGWMLKSKLAAGVRCALEHGGIAPVIVAADADFKTMVPKLVKGGFYHAGQVCVSVQRVFADKRIAKDLANALAEQAKELVVGDPNDVKTQVGPLIRPAEVDRIDKWIKEATDQGADILTGAKKISDSCYEPTILFSPPKDALVSTREIFGPVVCVYPYEKIEDAIIEANAHPFSFQSAVFTRSLDTALLAYRHLNASAVMVNEHTAFRVDWMPFAGLKESGYGVGGIEHTFLDMQIDKMLVLHSQSLA